MVDSVRKLQDVIVLAQKGINDKTPTIGKGNIVARDLPQLTQTIDKAVLDRQQVLKMSDLLQNTHLKPKTWDDLCLAKRALGA